MENRYIKGAELLDNGAFTVMELFKLMHEGRLHAFTEKYGQEVVNYNFRESISANEYFRDAINIHSYGGSKDIPLNKYIEICHNAAKHGLKMKKAEDATKYPFPLDIYEQYLAEISSENARNELRMFIFMRNEIDAILNEDVLHKKISAQNKLKAKEKKSYLIVIAALYAHIKKKSSESPSASAIIARGAAADIVNKVGQVSAQNKDGTLTISENTVKKIISEIEDVILE